MTLPSLEIQLNREMIQSVALDLFREMLLSMRDGKLKEVDAIERLLDISPRTVELRREAKAERYAVEMPKRDKIEVK